MPELLLTNTQTGGKERFEPQDPERITLYVCGPTVYNLVHIGNARPVVVFDVLYRVLTQSLPVGGLRQEYHRHRRQDHCRRERGRADRRGNLGVHPEVSGGHGPAKRSGSGA